MTKALGLLIALSFVLFASANESRAASCDDGIIRTWKDNSDTEALSAPDHPCTDEAV